MVRAAQQLRAVVLAPLTICLAPDYRVRLPVNGVEALAQMVGGTVVLMERLHRHQPVR
jgi:hypothetical protein